MAKRIRLPNIDVHLTDDEVLISQTKPFQRLSFLKQLGLAYLVYPGATHTRGAHSLQCLHEAEHILSTLDVSPDDKAAIRAAALLHDIGHVPFSHTLEDEHSVLEKHDGPNRLSLAIAMLSAELKEPQRKLVESAIPILKAISYEKNEQDWRSDIVGNTICADLLAYIGMDAAYAGIEKKSGHYRIYEYLTFGNDPTDGKKRLCVKLTKGGLRTDIVSAIMDLLDMRYALTERVIFHHAKCVASGMLARAARLVGLKESSELLTMGDEQFLNHLEQLAESADVGGARHILSNLRSRRLYQRIFRINREARESWDHAMGVNAFCARWRDGGLVEQALSEAEDRHDLPRGSLVVWCPEAKAGMKLARVKVVWESAGGWKGPVELREETVANQFQGVGKRVRTIEEQYQDLWTFWIALDREYADRAASVVKTLGDLVGIGCDPTFVETYLQLHPEYAAGAARTEAITKVVREIEPKADQILANTSALDGKPHLDEPSVKAVLSDLLSPGRSARQPSENRQQPHLFSPEDPKKDKDKT